MSFSKLSTIAGFMIAFAFVFELAAHADDNNQSTQLTFSQPVQIPGQILPEGTYQFVLADSPANRDIVWVFNADRTHLFATIQTVPTDRAKETTGTSITFAQSQDGQPPALVTWFYPGTETGHEFVFSKQVETKLAQDAKHTFVEEHGTMVDSDATRAGN
jgi:Protein of unknown function (DUF2911)